MFNQTLHVLHVWGTPYEMGLAHGKLLHDEVQYVLNNFMIHLEEQLDQYLQWMPEWLRKIAEQIGLAAALDAQYLLDKNYISSYWLDEIRGLADGSGLSYTKVLQLHMLPELVKAGCSMFGAWDTATTGGQLVQLRALDWDMTSPLQKHPVVLIHHFSESQMGHDFATLGWAGWISALTGMSSNGMAISEKFGDDFGKDSREGIPFPFLLRDILQFDYSLEDAINRMISAKRTCNIYLGVGDKKKPFQSARVFEYGASTLVIWDDQNQPNTTDHPRINDVVYRGVNQGCFSSQLIQYLGAITPLTTAKYIVPITKTGNLHAAVYDYALNFMYVANAAPVGTDGPANAYDRQWIRMDLNKLFSEKRP